MEIPYPIKELVRREAVLNIWGEHEYLFYNHVEWQEMLQEAKDEGYPDVVATATVIVAVLKEMDQEIGELASDDANPPTTQDTPDKG